MAYQKVVGSAAEVEVVQHHSTVFQGVTVHTAHHGPVAEVVRQTRNWTHSEERQRHLGCLLAQAGDSRSDWPRHHAA